MVMKSWRSADGITNHYKVQFGNVKNSIKVN